MSTAWQLQLLSFALFGAGLLAAWIIRSAGQRGRRTP